MLCTSINAALQYNGSLCHLCDYEWLNKTIICTREYNDICYSSCLLHDYEWLNKIIYKRNTSHVLVYVNSSKFVYC